MAGRTGREGDLRGRRIPAKIGTPGATLAWRTDWFNLILDAIVRNKSFEIVRKMRYRRKCRISGEGIG